MGVKNGDTDEKGGKKGEKEAIRRKVQTRKEREEVSGTRKGGKDEG